MNRDVFQIRDGQKVQIEVPSGRQLVHHEVESLSLFRDGIKPMYEDEHNKNGCDLQFKSIHQI